MGARLETGPGVRRTPRSAGLALAVLIGLGLPAQAAKLLAVAGTDAQGYARIAFTFDSAVSIKARLSNGVLVLGYGERTEAGPERLVSQLPDYLTAVRRDPDGSGLRLALQRTVRVNVQDAGEKVFVDLLPESWTSLPPPLPPEIVADLARRARAAEAILKSRNPAPVRRPLGVEVAKLPTLTRLTVRLPEGAEATVAPEGGATRLRILGAYSFDLSETRGRLRQDMARLTASADDASAGLVVAAGDAFTVSTDRDDDTVVFDIVAKKDAAAKAEAAARAEQAAKAEAATKAEPATKPEPASKGEPPSRVAPRTGDAKASATADVPAAAGPPGTAAPNRPPAPEPPERQAGSGLVFPFAKRPAVALFERGGVATLVFETGEPVALPTGGSGGLRALGEPVRTGALTALRFAVPAGTLLDLVPARAGSAAGAWELTAGDDLGPSDTLAPARLPDAAGHGRVAVGLPQPASAAWLDLDGERIAVVTARGWKPAGIAKRQRFVDFELLPSRFGLAVLAQADDLTVRPDLDGVVIGREGGLAVSSVARPPEAPLAEASNLAMQREPWEQARLGDVRETIRAQFGASIAASAGTRGPLRLTLARTQLANGLAPEALTTLDAASADDPLVASGRDTAILRAAALAAIGRNAEARRVLATEALQRDPEAVLWRAVADGQAGRWHDAEAGFQRTLPVIERYPLALQATIRTLAAESALETGDLDTALQRVARLATAEPTPLERDRVALVRARVDEATDRTKAALDAYDRLAESGERPAAAAAALRGTLLARETGKITPDEAMDRLERLAITWHGGEIENAITAGLARLYMAAGRYRDAFTAVRAADAIGSDAPETRALHDEAMALFDELYLSPRGDSLSGIDAVALYFDFKDFAPIGRRGDAVVRRLAERLVGLDLLDPAANLLQYQIDNRLTGPSRSSVATQLASIRLMDGKPLMALEAIEGTYLPELPRDLRRARSLLRARALSDLSRTDLALETIEGEAGPDAARLRADILWSARRWREAGEAHEALLGDAWRSGKVLDDAARADVIRAGIAYDLAVEPIGLERLKAKFSDAMADSADARTFALLTSADATKKPGFREIAQKATNAETLAAFLAEYRKRYPDASLPARGEPEKRADGQATPPG
ncbi:hypothetical protein MKK70_02665 [Methylobacterium sp. E-041]|uniref:hypothetical protein n=1 Tax=Methylobacterium sp. E-041 TaxID=2836573 RepID=UPI001FBC0250|nr:hypothetical protein [Methylobacterium sp. E-041]MCJ2104304.1 hypothetical protein [Methylobacterium sp. E-041]